MECLPGALPRQRADLWVDDEPDAADVLAGRFAWLRVLHPVVQRDAVVRDLLRAIRAARGTEAGRESIRSSRRSVRQKRWPGRGTSAVAGADARIVLGVQVQRHSTR